MPPLYYIKGADEGVFRRYDGVPRLLPDQVLWWSGWTPRLTPPDPSEIPDMSMTTMAKAKRVAELLKLPITGW